MDGVNKIDSSDRITGPFTLDKDEIYGTDDPALHITASHIPLVCFRGSHNNPHPILTGHLVLFCFPKE